MNPTENELKDDPTNGSRGLRVAWSVLLCALLVSGGFLAGLITERQLTPDSPESNFADLEAVYEVVGDDYYYLPTSDAEREEMEDEMEDGAIDGALLSLGDTYTRYLDVDESQTANESLEGKYGGIGVDVVLDGDVAFVSSVVPDSPAADAGIARGDVIEQVNGARVQTTDLNEVTRLLRGDIGADLSVTVVRPTTGEVLELDLVLEEIVIPSVILEFIDGTDYAWIQITIFGDTTVADLDAAIEEIRSRGSKGVILDLRGNGGGWVVAARQTLGRFIDPSSGPAMFEDTAASAEMEAMPIESAEGLDTLELPMVVLIDGGTASAAEIVAGCLKDYQRATIVGEKSFGKGSVQRIYEFSDGSTMRVTVAEWFTPSRGRIQSEGIRPDVEIVASEHASDSDPILDSGVKVLDFALSDSEATPVPTN